MVTEYNKRILIEPYKDLYSDEKNIINTEASMIADICRGVWFPPDWHPFPIK